MDIKGKTALITGASRGIGKAISIELANQGIKHLILVARDRQKLAEVATEIETIGTKVTTLSLDLTQLSSIDIVIAQTWCNHRPIHLLVNCAGIAHQSSFLNVRADKFEEEISLNILGMMNITRLLAKRMASQKEGTIVNVSSLMGKVAAPTMSTYSATKFAIVGFTQALRSELAQHNIKVIALLPTLTDTEMARNLKLFRWVIPVTPEKVAQTLVAGLYKNKSEILVGWQSYLAVLCQRIFPWLLQKIMFLSSPEVSSPRIAQQKKLKTEIV
ncbi:SDR family NAD(P)-dependent oxidoreductase [Waterburya agarophytonicola K14]|uniref:SDR family NAD(P)-dependent oxidoreductase n=1 Tax=Waterburya agarophytonicola KI4 TaxID=2874699 RepID=A0A964FH66_9CYAN|nr:SDR family NAD(P)-dependent oxidoreductase [Waterburya agarophytonicola]MCC0177193.1 SDR family NAD(P)-dependent oxidoreductase [Waterburya agarophytonicola KI4]